MKRSGFFIFSLCIPFALCMTCGRRPLVPEPAKGFELSIEYRTIPEPSFGGGFWKHITRDKSAKAGIAATDLVRIMALDLSGYDDIEDFERSESFAEYSAAREAWQGDLTRWEDWKALASAFFPVVSDQSLNIRDQAAEGMISGVPGLNGFLIAFFENGEMTHWGEGNAIGVAGRTQPVVLAVEPLGVVPDPFTLLDAVSVGTQPQMPVFSSDGEWIFSASLTGNTISVISTSQRRVDGIIADIQNPQAPAISPDGFTLFVAPANSTGLLIIDTGSRSVTDSVDMQSPPGPPALNADGSVLVVPLIQTNAVAVAESAAPHSFVTLDTGSLPSTPAFSADQTEAYVANRGNNSVSVVRIEKPVVLANIPVGNNPGIPAVTPDPGSPDPWLFVPNRSSGTLSIISQNTHQVIRTVFIGGVPQSSPAISPDGMNVWVSDGNGMVSVVSTLTQSVEDTVHVGDGPGSPVMSRDGAFVYVPNRRSGTLSIIETTGRSVILTLEAGVTPVSATVSADDRYIAVSDVGGNAVLIYQRIEF